MPDDKLTHLFKASIEHIEMDYLKAIAEGPGWPVFWVFDLEDPAGLEHARKVAPSEKIAEAIADARSRDVAPILILVKVIVEPYDVGENWWKDCPKDRFPVLVMTDGHVKVQARAVPQGIEDALRRRFLVEHAQAALLAYHQACTRGDSPVAVILADVLDDAGARAATPIFGAEAVEQARAKANRTDGTVTMIWAGAPTGASYPEAWGGPIPQGRFAAQVIGHGGVSNLTMAEGGSSA